jgi:hypothetical protein
MTEANSPEPAQVTCYSGRIYADRPASFVWQGVKYDVKDIEREWQEPGERHFVVKTEDDRRFELCYYEGQDQWSITEII